MQMHIIEKIWFFGILPSGLFLYFLWTLVLSPKAKELRKNKRKIKFLERLLKNIRITYREFELSNDSNIQIFEDSLKEFVTLLFAELPQIRKFEVGRFTFKSQIGTQNWDVDDLERHIEVLRHRNSYFK